MPALETFDRRQYAVYWPALPDQYTNDGEAQLGTRSQIQVRWEDTYREESDVEGNLLVVSVDVVTNFAPPQGSLFWKGRLVDIDGTGDFPETGALYRVSSVRTVPDLKNRNIRYNVSLTRSSSSV